MHDRAQRASARRIKRRRFLNLAATSVAAAVVSEPLFALQALAAPLVRHDIASLTPTSKIIKSYEKAITVMQGLAKSEPTSWIYQASIHGATPATYTSWGTCQHYNAFFWSWHRMYLYWFERIVRKKSGDPTWTLPFWAWDSPSERQIPGMFRNSMSKLYSGDRLPLPNGGASLTAAQVAYVSALSTKVFSTPTATGANDMFQGPHGSVHVWVGKGFGNFDKTGRDPLFWLHHANCDRMWEIWRTKFGGNNPTSDLSWTGKTFTFFDENGHAVNMTDCDVVNTAQQLKYKYQNVPAPAAELCPNLVAICCVPIVRVFPYVLPAIPPLGPRPVRVPLPIPPQLRQRLRTLAADPTKTIYLHLEGLTASTQPGVTWAAFVGPQSALSAAVMGGSAPADPEDPHYVGSVYLFGSGIKDEMGSMPMQLSFPLNRALAASAGDQELFLTFVAQGTLMNGAYVRPDVRASVNIGKATLLVQTLKQG
jgi:Common central domain of tyrosinase/Polyphenol oxidase middle domain